MNLIRAKKFGDLYLEKLTVAVQSHPEEYHYGVEQVPNVHQRMMDAVYKGTFNKDSKAIKDTCKDLGIKHTYTAIREYLGL